MTRRLFAQGRPRLRLGSVARNVAVVGGATALGQGVLVLAAPVLSRLYDPEDFGLLAVYAAVLSVLLAVASLRFDLAIPIASDPTEALHLLMLSGVLGTAASIGLAVAVLVAGQQIAATLGAAPLAPLLWVLPLALLVASVAQALSSWAVYARMFPALGRMRAIGAVAQAAGQTAFGVVHAGPLGLLLGDFAGKALGMEQLIRSVWTSLRSTTLSRGALWRAAHERWGFARLMTAASLVNALALQVPFLLIPGLFGLPSSGQYYLAYRVLILPASLVAAAVSQVFFGEASFRRSDPQRLHDLARNLTVSLLAFAIPTYTVVMVAGSTLIQAFLGNQWVQAGHYAQIMAPWLLLWSVASPISTLLLVGRRERESLAFTVAELALKVGSLSIGALLHSLTVGIIVLSSVSVLEEIAALWRFLRVASVSLGDLLRPSGRIVALTMPSLGLVVLVQWATPDSAAVLVACVLGWGIAFSLAALLSPEPRALLSGSHD